jgi:anti-sigma factor RsiW
VKRSAALEVVMQHLDEGTIHAWLDGALPPDEASAAETHVQVCTACAQAVAEARGLIAASSRILGALDDVPVVRESSRIPLAVPTRRRRGWWWNRAGMGYAAAATVLLAVGTTLVLRSTPQDAADVAEVLRETPAAPPQASSSAAPESERARAAAPPAESQELSTDRVVPLPGATPPVRQDARKAAVADVAAREAPASLVQGRVLDAATGAPIPGAVVSVDTARATSRTDSAGKFELQQVPPGRQTVSVRASGFMSAQHPVAVRSDDSVQLAFALSKTQPQQNAAGQRQELDVRQRVDAAARPATLQVDEIRARTEQLIGCQRLVPVAGAPNEEARRDRLAGMPARLELETTARARTQREETLINRARTIEGVGRAESWRIVGDSLEVTWTHGGERHVLRLARRDGIWFSPQAIMEPCDPR